MIDDWLRGGRGWLVSARQRHSVAGWNAWIDAFTLFLCVHTHLMARRKTRALAMARRDAGDRTKGAALTAAAALPLPFSSLPLLLLLLLDGSMRMRGPLPPPLAGGGML